MFQGDNVLNQAGRGPLFWRVFGINAVVFVIGTAILALSPATVSSPLIVREAVVLLVGLTGLLIANAVLLRRVLAPLDRLVMMMRDIDLLRPGQRLPVEDAAYLSHVVVAFNAMADRLEAERRKSAERALSIQEEERRRVARDLHDEIGQSLTALLLQLKRIAERSPQEICRELERAQEATRTTLEEVRGIVHRLRPGVLEDLGLKSALAEMASGFFKTTGIKVRRHIDPQVPRLSEQVELALYRICQESLTNVARHAHASCVELVLEPSNTGVRMRITDDGQGFDFSAIDDGGIRWMQERALLAGAQFELKVTRGRGVEVCVEAPATPEVARDAQPR